MKLTKVCFLGVMFCMTGHAAAQDVADEILAQKSTVTGSLILRMRDELVLGPGAEKTAETTGHVAEELDPELEALLEEATTLEE